MIRPSAKVEIGRCTSKVGGARFQRFAFRVTPKTSGSLGPKLGDRGFSMELAAGEMNNSCCGHVPRQLWSEARAEAARVSKPLRRRRVVYEEEERVFGGSK